MEQLKMYFIPGTPVRTAPLPDGFSISFFDPERDLTAWCDCLRNGDLLGDKGDEGEFRASVTDIPDIDPRRDVFFLDRNGEHIATATAFVYRGTNVGDVHMVGVREDCRGQGLAKYLMQTALELLLARGVRLISLTTDEKRANAIRAYLHAGFLPVEYDYRMQARWEAVLRDLGLGAVQMLYEDGSPYKTIGAGRAEPKVRFGVLGAGRGMSIMDYCGKSDNAELVAVCDRDDACLASARERFGDAVAYYTDFDAFLRHDMDLVVLANYANAHAPFAVRALDAGKNVLSELLPVQTMAEAVALAEAVERSGKRYFYGENCCFMTAPRRMRQLFKSGKMGAFQYGEGEYMHNCEPDWQYHSHCEPDHWRNTMSAFYYCTHSLGPLIHISGLRPVSVTGFEAPYNKKMFRMGAKGAPFGLEIVTLENGAILKSLHGVGPVKYSLWYAVQGEMGVLESARNITDNGGSGTLLADCDSVEGSDDGKMQVSFGQDGLWEQAKDFHHGGADYYMLYNICESLRGNRQADVIDLWEALDMFLPGMFAYFSVLDGGRPQAIPDLRDPAQREVWRHDTRCTDPAVAGDQLLPANSGGDPEIPGSVYERLRGLRKKD